MEGIEKGKLVSSGKAKSLYETSNPDYYFMLYRDDTSAFDGIKKESLEGKGATNNKFNAFIMDILEKEGVPTHFERILSETESLVKRLEMVPIECVIRNITAGSICKRLGIEEGLDLIPPTFEFFYKDDELHDPMINEYHIESFDWATENQVDQMKDISEESWLSILDTNLNGAFRVAKMATDIMLKNKDGGSIINIASILAERVGLNLSSYASAKAAVIDWEMVSIGNPMLDIGWMCINSWRFGQSEKIVGGFGDLEEFLQGYSSISEEKIDPEEVKIWQVLGTLRWGVICLIQVYSHLNGDVNSLEKAAIGRRVSETEIDLVDLLFLGGK